VTPSPRRKIAPLPADEVLLAAYHERGDSVARERLVERHMSLVRCLAWRYRASGEPYDDLVQTGCVGLVKAVDAFDAARGRSFLAYATPTILGEIRRHLRDRGGSVHMPRPLNELALAVRRISDDLTASLGRSPTIAEIASALDVDPEQVVEARTAAAAQQIISLAAPRPEGCLEEQVGVSDRAFDLVDDRSAAADGLRVLDARERIVVALVFLGGATQAEVATRLGVSQMQISRVLRRALDKANAAVHSHALAA
jgi:RNA polymerase sigma-B factor